VFSVDALLAELLKHEGGYSNNPDDPGGETNFGITIKTARDNGYSLPMKAMTQDQALAIYRSQYWEKPGFDKVFEISPGIAGELFDTGVNMGPSVPSGWLQRLLNAFNRGAKDYPDIAVDGNLGPATLACLRTYLKIRGDEGESVMLKGLNALQAERYIRLAEKNPALESFTFGWLSNRVSMSI
jgi:lysozyme family protein